MPLEIAFLPTAPTDTGHVLARRSDQRPIVHDGLRPATFDEADRFVRRPGALDHVVNEIVAEAKQSGLNVTDVICVTEPHDDDLGGCIANIYVKYSGADTFARWHRAR